MVTARKPRASCWHSIYPLMTRSCRLCLVLLAACGLAAGCARRELQSSPPGLLPPSVVAPVAVADEDSVAAPRADASALGTLANVQQRLPKQPPEATTRELAAAEAQSLAAANSKLANLMELEREAVAAAARKNKKGTRLATLQQQLLCLRAIHERN